MNKEDLIWLKGNYVNTMRVYARSEINEYEQEAFYNLENLITEHEAILSKLKEWSVLLSTSGINSKAFVKKEIDEILSKEVK